MLVVLSRSVADACSRLRVVSQGHLHGKADNAMRLGLCSRSKDVIEPMLKPQARTMPQTPFAAAHAAMPLTHDRPCFSHAQWWTSCAKMAADAAAAARDGRLEIIPAEQNATWFRWLDNIRDWCISRQLWWGHRIPAFYVSVADDGAAAGTPGMASERLDQWVVARTADEALAKAQARFPGKTVTVTQDEDVLDTWFSSGIFPFSVFGWPNQTPDLKEFYPTRCVLCAADCTFACLSTVLTCHASLAAHPQPA